LVSEGYAYQLRVQDVSIGHEDIKALI
jgi:hypothetical protein